MTVYGLTSSIKTRMASVLGATYTELGYAYEIEKNTLKGNEKRYACIPLGASEVTSTTRNVTLDQSFQLTLTDGFINRALSDSQAQTKAISLLDLMRDIYIDLVETRCGSDPYCINVSNLQINEPEIDNQNSVVIIRASITVRHRTSF